MPAEDAGAGKVPMRRRTAKEHGPDPVDIHVGQRLRMARELDGMTQVDIGRRLGMSFQVVQKYEQGEIRVSASRLFQFSVLLNKPIDYFFTGLEVAAPAAESDRFTPREIELIRAFRQIGNLDLRQRILQLSLAMDEASGSPTPTP